MHDQCWPAQECGCEIKMAIQPMVVIQLTQKEVTKVPQKKKKKVQLQ